MRGFCAGRVSSDVTCHRGKNGTYCRIWRLQFLGFFLAENAKERRNTGRVMKYE